MILPNKYQVIILSLNQQIKELKESLSEKDVQITNLENSLQQITDEGIQLQQDFDSLKSNLQSISLFADSKISELEDANKDLTTRVETLSAFKNDSCKEIENLNSKYSRLQTSYDSMFKNLVEYQAKNTELVKTNDSIKATCIAHCELIKNLTKQVDVKSSVLNNLNSDYNILKLEVARLTHELEKTTYNLMYYSDKFENDIIMDYSIHK